MEVSWQHVSGMRLFRSRLIPPLLQSWLGKVVCPESSPHSKLSVRKNNFAGPSVANHCFLAFRALQGNSNLGRCSNKAI